MKNAMFLFTMSVAMVLPLCGGESATALSDEFSLGALRANNLETDGAVEIPYNPAWGNGAKASVVAISNPGLESAVETVLAAGQVGETGSVSFTPSASCRLVHRVTDADGKVLGEQTVRCLCRAGAGTAAPTDVDSRDGSLQERVDHVEMAPVACDPSWNGAASVTLEKLRYAKEGGAATVVETLTAGLTDAETLPLSLAYDVRGAYALRLSFQNEAGDAIGAPMEAKYVVNRTIGTMIIFR